MPRPIESLLSLPRVRLVDRVPILEAEKLLERFMNRTDYRPKLVQHALRVSEGSARQFAGDDKGLTSLLEEVNSSEYVITKRSKEIMEKMLSDIYGDGLVFKGYEQQIQPLYGTSKPLRDVSKLADSLADKTKEESLDVARALMIRLPRPN